MDERTHSHTDCEKRGGATQTCSLNLLALVKASLYLCFYVGHPYYGQLSAVKTVYLLTSIAGLGVQLTGILFWKLSADLTKVDINYMEV